MPYNPTPTPGWVSLRSRADLEKAMAKADVNGNELARNAGTSRQNIANIRRGHSARIREDIAGSIERALELSRGALFDYRLPEPTDDKLVADVEDVAEVKAS